MDADAIFAMPYVGPWSGGDGIGMKWCCLCLSARLGSLACLAGVDVGLYVFLHLWPPIFL